MKQNQSGRSMIEMLGVLAIIAVLSVGGIAGYSKAMMKFKVNKWMDDVVTTIANFNTFYMNSKKYSEIDDRDMTDFYEELKIVPENMLDEQNRDVFGSRLVILSHIPYGHPEWPSRLRFDFYMQPSNGAVEECKAMFDIVPQYTGTWVVILNEATSSKTGGDYLAVCGKSAAIDYAKYVNCVPYNVAVIAQKCAICAKKSCDMQLIITNGI